ncbi:hypothetical protein QBC37DRAFT_380657 [Rhypophila decipiens]|uniref:Uncharacterized protein n=1 Tax=Rhypophila decipiens TaxID=261697 RepID=A0AAN6XUJ3_9PEZI|nr:hypothetical protein QBC37DRAFT_380657 [Rhypophila decipiens]
MSATLPKTRAVKELEAVLDPESPGQLTKELFLKFVRVRGYRSFWKVGNRLRRHLVHWFATHQTALGSWMPDNDEVCPGYFDPLPVPEMSPFQDDYDLLVRLGILPSQCPPSNPPLPAAPSSLRPDLDLRALKNAIEHAEPVFLNAASHCSAILTMLRGIDNGAADATVGVATSNIYPRQTQGLEASAQVSQMPPIGSPNPALAINSTHTQQLPEVHSEHPASTDYGGSWFTSSMFDVLDVGPTRLHSPTFPLSSSGSRIPQFGTGPFTTNQGTVQSGAPGSASHLSSSASDDTSSFRPPSSPILASDDADKGSDSGDSLVADLSHAQ